MNKRYFIIILLFAIAVLAATYQAVDGKKNVLIPNAALIIASKPPAEKPAVKISALPAPQPEFEVVRRLPEEHPAPDIVKQESVSVHGHLAAVDYYNLGISMLNEGMYEEAIGAFNEVLKITPGYGDAYYNLALANVALGNANAAFEEYRILRNIDAKAAEGLYNEITDFAMTDRNNKFAVQVGAFRNNAYADDMIEKLKARYFRAYIENTGTYHKVRICGIQSKEQGKRMMLDIENEFHVKPYLVKLK
jgi:tetratricopeptide (TPR) repeat protein